LPIAIVQHLDPHHRSLLPEILARRTDLRVRQAEAGDRLEQGTVFIAPPGSHLLVNADSTLSLSQAEMVHFLRPSADLLFESAADSFHDRVIAVVITGTGSDGAQGCRRVKSDRGTVIVQDPDDSEFAGMPRATIAEGVADYVVPLDEIGPLLMTLATGARL
jgi:two-component system chemotaxis response regulator CheB